MGISLSVKITKHKTYHTHAHRGKRVRVLTTDGESFVDKLVEYPRGKYHLFEEKGKVLSSTIYKVELYSKSYEIKNALVRLNRAKQ